jgi:8-oxo-dGTP diphosphatase
LIDAAIPVVAAVVRRGNTYLLCQRHAGPHLALKWEFPGGKIEPGEAPEGALRREIQEELATDCVVGRQLAEVHHDYPEKSVWIRFFETRLDAAPRPVIHRALAWVAPRDFGDYPAPPPNAVVLARILAGELNIH